MCVARSYDTRIAFGDSMREVVNRMLRLSFQNDKKFPMRMRMQIGEIYVSPMEAGDFTTVEVAVFNVRRLYID